jgi:hypothetical protein
MVLSPAGLRPKRDWAGEDQQQVSYRPVLSSRGLYDITNPQLSKQNFKEKETFVAGLRWVPDTKTDWPTDCRS